jgi:CO/xanthine dehydrogenase Mo-binding subunit
MGVAVSRVTDEWETPLRTGDPDGPQVTFASESFIDELAAAAKADPVEFRLRLLPAGTDDDAGFRRARSNACVRAVAEKSGWDARPSPKPRANGDILIGRGIAYSYILEAGSAPGLANLATVPVPTTTYAASGVPRGTYYLRVRAVNAIGTGAASAEVQLVVP